MPKEDLVPGVSGEVTVKTTPEMGITHLGPGIVSLLSTPSMIGLMERASHQLLAASLNSEEGSVGVKVNITHLAATPIGMTVTAKSTVESIKDRRVSFAVEAYNEKEKIGEGTHERVIIQKSRFSKDSDKEST